MTAPQGYRTMLSVLYLITLKIAGLVGAVASAELVAQ